MEQQAGRFNAMRPLQYSPARANFPLSVYPLFFGMRVQFAYTPDEEKGRILFEGGEIMCTPYLINELTKVAQSIINEDNSPHFEAPDWNSGVMIEGRLSSINKDNLVLVEEDPVGDFGDVPAIHFIAMVAVPHKFWLTGRDRYDMGTRRATLMRAMGRLGMLAEGNESNCWLLPRYSACNEYAMMTCCERLGSGCGAGICNEGTLTQFVEFPVVSGMVYDFCLPWSGPTGPLQTPTMAQIEDGLL